MNHLKRLALSSAILTTTVGLMGCPGPAETPDSGTAMVDTGTPGSDTGTGGRDAGRDTGGSSDAGRPDAFAPRCGDGTINGSDACDDGNMTAGDGCSATCTAEAGFSCNTASPTVCTPVCGDGMRLGAEAGANGCDDNNMTAGDGCSATCTVESGFSCSGAPSVCMTGCGDRVVAGTETCDDGNTTSGDGCAASCASETGYTCTGSPSTCTSTCGDGLLAAGRETCDDMNTMAGDGCSAMCATEAGFTCMGTTCTATCGDGMTVGTETCDDMNTVTEACAYGLMSCTVCDATCQNVPGATSFCGNSTMDGAETCDDGNAVTETCMYGAMSCTVCGAMCNSVPGATSLCGDSRTDAANETCDDGNTVTEACAYGLMSCTVCNATCQSAPGAATFCGDNTINGMELCDDGNAVTETACPYGMASCTLCNATCAARIMLLGPTCGDGIVNGPEACDDGFTNAGDGCSATCTLEAGFTCAGTPSRCSTTVRYTGMPVAVPDNVPAGIRVPITVPTTCTILDVSSSHTWEPNHTFAGDVTVGLVAPNLATATLSNRVGGGNDLDGPYVFAQTGATWPGAGAPAIAAGTYAANYNAILGGPANGTWNLVVSDLSNIDTGSIAQFSVTVTCAPAATVLPATTARTCGQVQAASGTAPDGTYIIDPDGAAGAIAPARVYCDMTNGGWTLVMASNSLGPNMQTASTSVLPGSGRYLPAAFAQALATVGSQVHIRTAGAFATRSITSVPNTLPIQNLRAGLILTNNSPFRGPAESVAALWTGPFAANAQYLWHTCGPAPFGMSVSYPNIYHACNNPGGMHILSTNSGWTSTAVENMEVYVR